jgi:hypothetical protein
MDNEDKVWITVWAVIGTSLICLAIVVSSAINSYNQKFVDAGYCQTMQIGYASYLWQKCK